MQGTTLRLVHKLMCWAVGDNIKAVGTATRYCSKYCHCCIPCKHSSNLCKWRSVSYLTLENLTECDVDEATGWQGLKQAIGKVYDWTRTNWFENGRREEQSNWVHQRICHSSNDHRLVTVVNTNELKTKAKSNDRLVDKVSNKNWPNL